MEVWDLSPLLGGKTPDQLLDEANSKLEEFKKIRDELDSLTPSRFKEILELTQKINILIKKVNAYYGLKFTEKTNDTEILAKISHLEQLGTDVSNEMLFFDVWFLELDDEKAKKFIDSEELKIYKPYLIRSRKYKPYTKSEEIEQIINLKSMTGGDSFSHIYDVFTNAFKFEFDGKSGLSQEEVSAFYMSDDPKIRKAAYDTIYGKYKKESVLLSEIYKNIVLDWYNEGVKIRGHKSPISIRNMYNDINDSAVETLLKVCRKNVGIWGDYFKLKHDILTKQEHDFENSRYHVYTPYKETDKKYDYETCKKIVLETYKEFDPRFYEAAKRIFDEKAVHSHPQPNKRSGAFCWGVYNKSIPYIMLNHTDKLRDLFTMMHEFGHGIHDILAADQVDLLYRTSLPMAETASMFGEMVLAGKLLKNSEDKEEKIGLLINTIDDQYKGIPRQAYFAIFEKKAHEMIVNGATKDELEEEYMKMLKEQFGEMEIPDIFANEWNYIPHIHHTPFYCYAYAWGNLLVLAFYAMYKEQGSEFVEKYVKLLSSGGGDTPENLMKAMGVDPNSEEFWQKGFNIIKEEIEELKKIANI